MNVVALIPAYEPDERLVGYVEQLAQHGFERIVVVDDGSGERYSAIFDAVAANRHCKVLRHDSNMGKGAALKTGLAFIGREFGDADGVVTADSDGQHAPEDCRRMADALSGGGRKILLGHRRFALGSVPFLSWYGNRWASVTFGLIHGRWLPDTQTGLRAFPISMLPFLLGVSGERFEYEMGVLIAAARNGVEMESIPIRTIYENGNAGTHFRPLADTIRINRLVFADFIRFAGVSLASFALDQGLAWGFAAALAAAHVEQTCMIWISGFAARLLSATFNFSLNRTFVFRSNGGIGAAAWKYALLCVAVIVLSNAGVTGLCFLHVPRGIAKFMCDIILYFVGYRVQSKIIFCTHAGQDMV